MTERIYAGDAGQATASANDSAAKRGPLFQPFEWTATRHNECMPSHLITKLASQTRDIASGVAVLVEIFERDDIDAECADENGNDLPPLLGATERGNLMRLAVASLHLLAEQSSSVLERVDVLRGEPWPRRSEA